MCSCPAHRELVDCTCNCDHTTDRLLQWKARALTAEAEMEVQRAIVAEFDQVATEKGATVERVEALRDDWARGRAPTAVNELSAALASPVVTAETGEGE
jgi:hypothetical protein